MTEYRFAERVRKIEISGIRRMFEGAGEDAINLGLGQPDFPTPEHVREAGVRAIRDGLTGYTMNAGVPELREAIAEKFERENGLHYTPDQVIVTAGASEALHIVMQALVGRGDRVLVTDPGFVSYAALAALAGGRSEGVPLDATFHIDVEAAKEQMDGARLFVLNSPTNPTGMVESEESLRALVEYAADADVTVVSDEVYEHFTYGKPHVSAARFGEDVVTINATSKTYSMTGWRLGYMAAPKPVIEECIKVHQYCQACAASISQYAALAALTGDQTPVSAMREEYRRRRDLVYKGLADLGLSFPMPEGAFYAFVPMGEELFKRILAKGVIIVPGTAFGRRAPEYARLSYAASEDDLRRALGRIGEAVEES